MRPVTMLAHRADCAHPRIVRLASAVHFADNAGIFNKTGAHMTASLYEISVLSYLQSLEGVATFMQKGRSYAEEHGIELGDIVETRLRDDMLPFRFQVQSVARQSMGAIDAIMTGQSSPPKSSEKHSYQELEQLIEATIGKLRQVDRDSLNAKSGAKVTFSMPGLELPFTAENWILSFSLPNLYFHAATAYDILRIKGVPLSKRDLLGTLRLDR
jgi:hypothetical protein